MRPAPANGGGLWRTTTAAFSAPTFSYLWTASAMFSFAQWMERTAVGWVVLEETGSVFLTALAWALRTAPGAVIGPLAGALADRFPRQLLLGLAGLLRAIALGSLALFAATGNPPVALIMVLVMASGAGMTLNIASLQPLARDLVGPEGAMNAISINAFGQRVMGAPGALLAGFMLAGAGAAATFGAAALLMLAAGGLYLRVRPGQSQRPMQREPFRKEVADGLRVAVREPLVAALLALMIVTENLGFAFNSVLPAVAEDVMDAGSEGLGALGFAIGMGSMLGTLGLAALGDYRRKGLLLTGTVAGFGALMIALGATDLFAIGLLAAAGLGAAMAAVDALEWIILQENVADEYRGRVMGAWNVAIGLGWLGPVALGAVAAGVGVQLALVIFGAMLAAAGFAAGRTRLLRAA